MHSIDSKNNPRAFLPLAVLGLLSLSRSAPVLAQDEISSTSMSVSTSASLSAAGEASQSGLAGDADPGSLADAGSGGDFLHQFEPFAGAVELGGYVGMLFVSDQNSFRGPASIDGGRVVTRAYSEFRKPAPEFGVRAGYFPLSFLGAELEGMMSAAETTGDQGTKVLSARTHLVVQSPLWRVVPFAVAGAGYWRILNEASGNDTDPAFHFGGGIKLAASSDVAVRLDVRDTITNQRAIGDYPHNLEVTAGASWVLGRPDRSPPPAPVPLDTDGDGLDDAHDACPVEPGPGPDGCPPRDRDGDSLFDDNDQCPDQAGPGPTGCPPGDQDGDGVSDDADQCLSEAGVAPTGCPDRDDDGVLDRDDECPDVQGLAPVGCPPDSDGDGLADPDDRCPLKPETANGFEDDDGCPDEIPEAVKSFTGVIPGIEFNVNQASIRAGSQRVLNEAARILNEYPTLRVRIVGHTDDTGSRDHNLELSLARAESVKEYLVSQGVASERILTRGAGPDEPLEAGSSARARQRNRRIEFSVVQ